MSYKVTLKKKAIKSLTKINEPYYSFIKDAIYNLGENPRPKGYKKLKNKEINNLRVWVKNGWCDKVA
jgi:mRNA interferase RelE/StbE